MKIALFSDIHGNTIALDAVLADIRERGGVDADWVVGDLTANRPDPVGVLERIVALPQVQVVRGNADRYTMSTDRPAPSVDAVRANLDLLPTALEVAGTYAWTHGAITARGWLPWLRALPLEQTQMLPDGTRMLGVHAAPGRDDGDGIAPGMTDGAIAALLSGCTAQIVCVGHTHRPMDRHVAAWRVINGGSISYPLTADWRASYAILTASPRGCSVAHYRVTYDRHAVIRQAEELGHPGAAYIRRLMGTGA